MLPLISFVQERIRSQLIWINVISKQDKSGFIMIRVMVNVLKFRTLLFLFSNKMVVIRAGNHKMLVQIANSKTLIRV